MNEPRSFRIARAGLADLRAIRDFVREAAVALDAGDDLVADLVIAVDEAATNIIRHGYHGHGGPVEVEIERSGDDVTIRLRDEAPPFDPTTWPTPDLNVPLHHRPAGGLGIHLTRSSVDRVHHRRRGDAGNELILVSGAIQTEPRGDR